jgi:cell division protein FtsQ
MRLPRNGERKGIRMMRDYKNKEIRNSRTVLLKKVRKKALARERRWADLRRLALVIVRALLVVVLLTGGVVTAHAMLTAPLFMVKEITLHGNEHMPEQVLRRYEARLLKNIFLVNLKGVRKDLLQEPYIKDVFIRRELPDRVFIQIEERIPFAELRIKRESYLIDRDGTVLEALENKKAGDLPVINGGKRERDMAFEGDLSAALYLVETVENYGYPDMKEIREIALNPDEGVVLYPVSGGFKIRFGSGDFLQKMILLKKVVADVVRRGWPVRVIDLRFQDQVVVDMGAPEWAPKG